MVPYRSGTMGKTYLKRRKACLKNSSYFSRGSRNGNGFISSDEYTLLSPNGVFWRNLHCSNTFSTQTIWTCCQVQETMNSNFIIGINIRNLQKILLNCLQNFLLFQAWMVFVRGMARISRKKWAFSIRRWGQSRQTKTWSSTQKNIFWRTASSATWRGCSQFSRLI